MLLQDKTDFDNAKMLIKNRRGVSEMVGYVLLVVFAVIIGAIVFTWLKTYVPAEALNCPDGVSVFVDKATFDSSNSQLKLTLKNNGRFDIAGYFIHATNSSAQELPTIDLSPYLNENFGGKKFGNSVIIGQGENLSFGEEGNLFKTGDAKSNTFDIPPEIGELYSIRIVPTRFQEENKRQRFVSCSDAKVQQLVGEPCVPEDISVTCSGRVCGNIRNNCGVLVTCPPGCTGSDVCTSTGSCVPLIQCTDTCQTYGYECGTWEICGASTVCGTCSSGFECELPTGQCTPIVCGNGDIEEGETCDDGNTNNFDGCSSVCIIEISWICSGEPSSCTYYGGAPSCTNYCLSLNKGYTNSNCPANPGQCTSQNGDPYEIGTGGYTECTSTGATGNYVCCCKPKVIV